jgi:hypothetical protein
MCEININSIFIMDSWTCTGMFNVYWEQVNNNILSLDIYARDSQLHYFGEVFCYLSILEIDVFIIRI